MKRLGPSTTIGNGISKMETFGGMQRDSYDDGDVPSITRGWMWYDSLDRCTTVLYFVYWIEVQGTRCSRRRRTSETAEIRDSALAHK